MKKCYLLKLDWEWFLKAMNLICKEELQKEEDDSLIRSLSIGIIEKI